MNDNKRPDGDGHPEGPGSMVSDDSRMEYVAPDLDTAEGDLMSTLLGSGGGCSEPKSTNTFCNQT